jgi:hypothetical protein
MPPPLAARRAVPRASAAIASPSGARQVGRPSERVDLPRRGAAGHPHDLGDAVTRRLPSAARAWQTTRSIASATCSRMAACGRPTSAISASVSSRRSASAALPAWTVQSEPSCRSRARSACRAPPAADLADHDPVRPHPQRVLDEPPDRDLAAPFEVRRPGLEPEDVRLAEAELGGVLDRDDALPGSMKEDSALSSVVLPEPVPPQTSRLQRRRTARASSSASGAVSVRSPPARRA